MLKPKVLYFISTDLPTNYDRQVASKIEASVAFRNIKNAEPGLIEACDGVTGVSIPAAYQDKPTAKAAVDTYHAAISSQATASQALATAKHQEAVLEQQVVEATQAVSTTSEAE